MRPGRQIAVFVFLLGFATVLGARLYYWQVRAHDWLADMAQNEHVRDEQIPARRGAIYDVSGNVLATNEAVDSVYAARKQIDNPERTADLLSGLIDVPRETILQRITDQNSEFIRLKLWVPSDVS